MSDNDVDLSDNDVSLSDNDVSLSDLYVELSVNFVVICMALTGKEHVLRIFLTNEQVTSQHNFRSDKSI